ncbi:MAG: ribonuclease Y [Candidatus Veblenbacteria bacterium RIFOXYB1_FULL_43_13]|uniref:Ribonuclease Y n=1 Tax=Candidatus Veblenbacteria bacterium RIFOXYB1_FULL_43_13 TaxID=1802426 RepID=A0A1G2Q417_9BACT|nr:MAG: ribonuclease Y [Candidatus Veblenbacteria bacterium RIFOXYB1_FULL_43_13]
MGENLIPVAFLAAGLAVGIAGGYVLRKLLAVKSKDMAEAQAMSIINEAKNEEKDILIKAKEQSLKLIEEAKQEESDRRKELQHLQERLEKREATFDQKLLDLESEKQRAEEERLKFEGVREEIKKIREDQLAKLEKIAGLSQEDAKKVLVDYIEEKNKEDLTVRIRKLEEGSTSEVERRARTMLAGVMERIASSHAIETTTSVVNLPSDDMKGRIIGKEGRNIKAIEQLTGVEIIVDETPGAIVLSGFNPIRRHVAKKALETLLQDGRIHPGRIEEAIEKAKREMTEDIKKAGEEAAYEVGVAGLDPKLIQLLGRLKFRTSYGQNVLQHSKEVALISKLLAEELGANVTVAVKGGLLHDIGKAVDHEIQGSHPEIGYDIMKKFGLPEEIAYLAIAHHEDNPKTLEGVITKVADAVSGARPGARKDTYENYLQRLQELEDVATGFEGVEKAYAIQAGREVRVFVRPGEIDDFQAVKMARSIADKIEQELKYPGEIKVNVIRETRIIEYAR